MPGRRVAEEERLMGDDALLRGKGTYTAVYSREPDGVWIVYIRDALSLWYDDAEGATIVDRIELAPALKQELVATTELARRHGAISKELAMKRRRAIRSLQESGIGTRDIAELLELSQQRVSRIARGTR